MFDNGKWDDPEVVLYCQVGKAVDMLDFSINQAIKNSGLPKEDFDIFMICWRTSDEAYDYLRKRNLKYVNMEYDGDKDFLWNLYKGWNLGYEVGFKHADYVCPIATDHAFYMDWLKNLFSWANPNRIVNCKLIEPGTLPTLHTARNLGVTLPGEFKEEEFLELAGSLFKHELVTDEAKYGHRLDAMPFICPRDIWERFGPMATTLVKKITGDTDFFNRCKKGGVEITKALDSISYHCGGFETRRNNTEVTRDIGFKSKVKQLLRGKAR
ncbi:MAG: hypothetical protein ACREBU_00360 [Nitrososphaera sp.]